MLVARTFPLLLSLAFAQPALAQVDPGAGAWKLDGPFATVTAGGIGIPAVAGALSLSQTGEASLKGKGVDNVAQYESDDHEIQGTIYVFYPRYADTALATWATDRAIRERFGPNVTLAADSVVTVGGVPHAGVRRIYQKGELTAGKPLTTAAGFVRAGSWIIAVRVSGPSARNADVEAALDALLAGMRFDGKDKPMEASPLNLAAPCPAVEGKRAKLLKDKAASSNTLLASLLGGSIVIDDKTDGTVTRATLLAFPQNGAKALCLRGVVDTGQRKLDVLSPANADDGQIALILLDDAGGTFAVEPALLLGKGFVVKHYGIGTVDVLGSYDAMPTLAQIGDIMSGADKQGGIIRSSTTFTPDGKSTINIDPDTLK
ncbi:MAG: hypothetical protein WC729_08020 [Sphingomonas sp.]|jgi:hypothetical protein|uniref:hypothetical protein n=1 Tax=Sphingomonas sp. TaxID=28214 RepID=UPI0035698224